MCCKNSKETSVAGASKQSRQLQQVGSEGNKRELSCVQFCRPW